MLLFNYQGISQEQELFGKGIIQRKRQICEHWSSVLLW